MANLTKVFILHGWTYTTDKWQNLVAELAKNGFEAVILPIPGLTDGQPKVRTLTDYVEWLSTTLKAETSAILLAHSNGGRIAITYAAQYPQKVSQLILMDSAGIYHHEPILQLKRTLFKQLAKLGQKVTSSPRLKGLLYKIAREQDYQSASPEMKQTMVNLISIDLTPQLPLIKAPTLIIWGRDDRSTPLSDGQLMQQLIKDSRLEIIDGARHSPFYTHPDAVARLVTDFLR